MALKFASAGNLTDIIHLYKHKTTCGMLRIFDRNDETNTITVKPLISNPRGTGPKSERQKSRIVGGASKQLLKLVKII